MLIFLTGSLSALSCIGLGGGLYETSVVDAVWPHRPDLIQPSRGGLSRVRFWIPAHSTFEVLLLGSLYASWNIPSVCTPLLYGLGSHLIMRVWSFSDHIPKAIKFEQTPASEIKEEVAREWTKRSVWRIPLAVCTVGAMFTAFVAAAKLEQ